MVTKLEQRNTPLHSRPKDQRNTSDYGLHFSTISPVEKSEGYGVRRGLGVFDPLHYHLGCITKGKHAVDLWP